MACHLAPPVRRETSGKGFAHAGRAPGAAGGNVPSSKSFPNYRGAGRFLRIEFAARPFIRDGSGGAFLMEI